MTEETVRAPWSRRDAAFLGAFALLKFLINGVATTGYGYFRDELYYIACADHLAWGYVDHPPLSIAVLLLFKTLFGESLFAIHFPAILIGCATVVLTGMIAREMGGGRFAQAVACLCVIVAPIFLAMSAFFSMNPFDQFFWTLGAWVLVRLINSGNPNWWLWFGVVAGLGLMNKISVLFLGAGVVGGMLLTPHRKYFLDWHLYAGGLIALALFLPHLIWQVLNGWPTVEFTHNAAVYKNAPIGVLGFLMSQVLLTNPITVPIWLRGLAHGLFGAKGKPYRWLAFVFIMVFLILSLTYGKDYYLSPAFPMLFALGAVALEKDTANRKIIRPIYLGLMIIFGILLAPFALPILPIEQTLRYFQTIGITPPPQERNQTGAVPQHFADRFGWPEMVAFIAGEFHKLSPEDQARCGILVGNYGNAGAIDFFGKQYGLPKALCGHNNYYLWGTGDTTGEILLVYGYPREELEEVFEEVAELARFYHPYVMPYQNDAPLFLCRRPKISLHEAWPKLRGFI